MLNFEGRTERERRELIEAMAEGIALVKDSTDRIGNIWALKKIAENVARLDELDQLEGFLPPQVRPPVMMRWCEADLALQALREYARPKGCDVSTDAASLMKKLMTYLVRVTDDQKKLSTERQSGM
jgi:hypothetical protein